MDEEKTSHPFALFREKGREPFSLFSCGGTIYGDMSSMWKTDEVDTKYTLKASQHDFK